MAGGEGGWRKGYLFELCWLVLSFIVSPRLRAVVHPIDSSSHWVHHAHPSQTKKQILFLYEIYP
jgi:hypothetical protein